MYEWWVERIDGQQDLTCPFRAQNKRHADAWITQRLSRDTCKVVRRLAIQDDAAWQLRVATAFKAGRSMAQVADAERITEHDVEEAIRLVMQRIEGSSGRGEIRDASV